MNTTEPLTPPRPPHVLLSDDQRHLKDCVRNFTTWLEQYLLEPLHKSLKIVSPAGIKDLVTLLSQLEARYPAHETFPLELRDDELPAVRRAVLHRRRSFAKEHEELRIKTTSQDVLEQLDRRAKAIEALMDTEWFRAGPPHPLPCLTDYLNIQEASRSLGLRADEGNIEYDEKFRILRSPSQFLDKLERVRTEAWLRRNDTAVAFIDIDDFKRFNTKYTEFLVDGSILPTFMRALEAHVHSHAFAYRFGGDEYVVILPNADLDMAIHSLHRFQKRVNQLIFERVTERLTVSIGLCHFGSESILTEREVLDRATHAKHDAKNHGKNCVAIRSGDDLGDPAPSFAEGT